MSKIIIGVMGPGQATPADEACAFELGQRIAAAGWVLLTGGRNVGVMDAANRGAKQAGGLTVGILPNDLNEMSTAVDIPILTGMGNARNVINALSCRVVIACGMGLGTVSEVAIALKLGKPVVLLNCPPTGQQFFQQLATDRVHIAAHASEAIAIVHQLVGTASIGAASIEATSIERNKQETENTGE